MTAAHETWSGRLGFLLATIGSAVGIGSIWKFPYEAGANGGGMFVAFYIAGLTLIVVPLMFAEFATGRRGGGGDPGHSLTALARTHGSADGAAKRWGSVGVLGVVTGFIILSFYTVIGGWTLGYAVDTALHGLPGATAQQVDARYREFLASPWQMLGYHALFMIACTVIVARGISHGIETACMVLMPVLGVLMVALAGYSLVEGDFIAAVRFLFVPDFSHFNARTALDALGLGFFSIGVGLGLMITYAAFAGADVNLRQVAIWSVLADTAISLLAGLAVFPVVFAHGLDPASGPGLVFVTLPLAFAQMPFGTVAACAFFLLLFIAALASAISLLELAVAMLVRRYGWSQAQATVLAATLCFVAGIATVLSFSHWAAWQPLAGLTWAKGLTSATIFDLLDYLTSNILLPASGFGIAVFAGWVLPRQVLVEELGLSPRGGMMLGFLLRYLAPASIVAIAVANLML